MYTVCFPQHDNFFMDSVDFYSVSVVYNFLLNYISCCLGSFLVYKDGLYLFSFSDYRDIFPFIDNSSFCLTKSQKDFILETLIS